MSGARPTAHPVASRVAVVLALTAILSAGAPQTSHAGSETLQRSVQNLLFFPLDFVLSPVTGTRSVINHWRDSDDSTAVKIAYPVFGVAWATGLGAGASLLRGVAGALELLPGLVLLPTDSELDTLYELPEEQEALVDEEVGFMNVRFGVDYVSPSTF